MPLLLVAMHLLLVAALVTTVLAMPLLLSREGVSSERAKRTTNLLLVAMHLLLVASVHKACASKVSNSLEAFFRKSWSIHVWRRMERNPCQGKNQGDTA